MIEDWEEGFNWISFWILIDIEVVMLDDEFLFVDNCLFDVVLFEFWSM